MTKKDLQNKLAMLLAEYKKHEAYMEVITQRRINADMGDDYRENEEAKFVMEQHDIWWIRRGQLKREIGELRKKIIGLKGYN